MIIMVVNSVVLPYSDHCRGGTSTLSLATQTFTGTVGGLERFFKGSHMYESFVHSILSLLDCHFASIEARSEV